VQLARAELPYYVRNTRLLSSYRKPLSTAPVYALRFLLASDVVSVNSLAIHRTIPNATPSRTPKARLPAFRED
jgi:hypothetical protein